jgi:calcineurin-like phosphoesterase family protein
MIWFTSDEHYGHKNILKYCSRPYSNIEEHDENLIRNHNEVVSDDDTVFHAGDFTLMHGREKVHKKYIMRLKGKHRFIVGSHDYWLQGWNEHEIFELKHQKRHIVICHYSMRTWARSHYNSWQLYGHSHGKLEPIGKQWDIGVDNNNYYPVSFDQITEIMKTRPDNPNLIKRRK